MGQELRLAGVIRESIVDGPGIRFVVFAQGCPHHCKGCQNPETFAFDGGYLSDTEKILKEIKKNPLLSGVTLSGGEPFCQPHAFAHLAREVKKMGMNVMAYSGWTFEELLQDTEKQELLQELDYLVDGKFLLEEKTLALKFRGSKNQRILDAQQSFKRGEAIKTDWANREE